MTAKRKKLLTWAAPRLGYAYIRFLGLTMRFEGDNHEKWTRLRAEVGQCILAFWHSRLAMMPYGYGGDRIVVLSSRHRDSQMLAWILHRFGMESAWGSSTRGGSAGMRELVRRAREGYDIAFTPDGPRGPRRRAKPGVVTTAKLSGLPIMPVAYSARPAQRLRSWDRTLVPRPFSRGLFLYGEPVRVPESADATEIERLRELVEARIDDVTDRADLEVGLPVEEARPARDAS
jgi:lysophospholipid acyltransferase (LPLAT)-like uncharacterized protein